MQALLRDTLIIYYLHDGINLSRSEQEYTLTIMIVIGINFVILFPQQFSISFGWRSLYLYASNPPVLFLHIDPLDTKNYQNSLLVTLSVEFTDTDRRRVIMSEQYRHYGYANRELNSKEYIYVLIYLTRSPRNKVHATTSATSPPIKTGPLLKCHLRSKIKYHSKIQPAS
jgi:hypothetical protein